MSIVSEFKTFMMRGNVVDLAVGVVIGGAFGKIVTSLVDNIIMPPIGFITGGVDFSNMKWILVPADAVAKKAEVAVSYGIFINTIIQFLIIGAAIFLVVKAINKLMPPPPAADPSPPGPSQEELLGNILAELKKQNAK
jgi:large conductance mechanosensitive channel